MLPTWMRYTMLTTCVMNAIGVVVLSPAAGALREMAGLPSHSSSLYLAVLAAFILIFGVAYGWAGITGRADTLFIAVGAAGKLAFFGILTWFWVVGELPARTVMLGSGDLMFGILFLAWLSVYYAKGKMLAANETRLSVPSSKR